MTEPSNIRKLEAPIWVQQWNLISRTEGELASASRQFVMLKRRLASSHRILSDEDTKMIADLHRLLVAVNAELSNT